MFTQSVIFISMVALSSISFAASDDIYQSIEKVKIKLQNTPSFEIRKKDFMKFYGHTCMQRQALRNKTREAHKQYENSQISLQAMTDIDLERYNYYELCDFLKEIPLTRNKPLTSKSCDEFLNDLKRSSQSDTLPGEVQENPAKDLNVQATLIGQLLYRCQR